MGRPMINCFSKQRVEIAQHCDVGWFIIDMTLCLLGIEKPSNTAIWRRICKNQTEQNRQGCEIKLKKLNRNHDPLHQLSSTVKINQ